MSPQSSVSGALPSTSSEENLDVLKKLGIPSLKEDPDYLLQYDEIIRLEKKGKYRSLEPCQASKEDIRDLAERLRSRLRLNPTTDFYALIKANRGRISYVQCDQLKAEDGSIFIHADRTFDVILPAYTSPSHDRFTLAHELGHYILHSPRTNSFAFRRDRDLASLVEWEANWFAACLLMPEQAFLDAMKETKKDIDLLAIQFGVSRQAAEVRLQSLM